MPTNRALGNHFDNNLSQVFKSKKSLYLLCKTSLGMSWLGQGRVKICLRSEFLQIMVLIFIDITFWYPRLLLSRFLLSVFLSPDFNVPSFNSLPLTKMFFYDVYLSTVFPVPSYFVVYCTILLQCLFILGISVNTHQCVIVFTTHVFTSVNISNYNLQVCIILYLQQI